MSLCYLRYYCIVEEISVSISNPNSATGTATYENISLKVNLWPVDVAGSMFCNLSMAARA